MKLSFRLVGLCALIGIVIFMGNCFSINFPKISVESWGIILCLVFFHFLIEPIRWLIYIGNEKKGVFSSIFTLFSVCSFSSFASYVLPAKLGLPLRFFLIKRQSLLSADKVGLYILVDSILSIFCWTIASAILGGEIALQLIQNHSEKIFIFIMGLIVIFSLCLIIIAYFFRNQTALVIDKVIESYNYFTFWKIAMLVALLSIDIIGYIIRHIAILNAFSIDFIEVKILAAITVLSIYSGFISMLPMGMFGYDAMIILLLTQNGVSLEVSVFVPLLNRIANLAMSILLGIPSAFVLGLGINYQKIIGQIRKRMNYG